MQPTLSKRIIEKFSNKKLFTPKNLILVLIVVVLYLSSCSTGPGASTYGDPIAKAIAAGTKGISGSILLSALLILLFDD